jgi:hypothetical protein
MMRIPQRTTGPLERLEVSKLPKSASCQMTLLLTGWLQQDLVQNVGL